MERKEQIFSLFIAVLMVGSIVGFTAFYNFPEENQGNEDTAPQQPTALDFEATGIDATVFQLLPSIKLQAETEETDLLAVNSSIYAIEGVKRVNGSFYQSPYAEAGFFYLADISFDADLNSEYVLGKIDSATSLHDAVAYDFALIELPKTIAMQSVDQSLGMSREYTFSENISEALVNEGSRQGDSLKVSVTATFIGDNATNLMAFEEENITAKPVQKNAVLSAPVASLEPRLLFSSSLAKSQLDPVSSLKEDALKISGIIDANVFFSGVEAKLALSSQASLDEETLSGLESFLYDLNAETVSLSNPGEPLSGTVSFPEEISSALFLEKISLIKARLEGLGINASVEESNGFLSGQAALSSTTSAGPGNALKSLLSSKGIDAEVSQPAELSVQEIQDADSEAAYAVESGIVSAMLLPGHSLGDKVSVEVSYTLVRGAISSASAEEK